MSSKSLTVFLLLTLGTVSCSDDISEIGADFFDSDELQSIYVDSLTLTAYTVLFDSLDTYKPARLLTGSCMDKDLGIITTKAFFEIYPQATVTLNKESTRYSRATLELTYEGYSYYDTALQTTLHVHRLSEQMELSDEGVLYASSEFTYFDEPIGTKTFTPKPMRSDLTVDISLDDQLGKELFTMVQQSSDIVSSKDKFLEYFKGLVLVPEDADASIIGFNNNPVLRVYYYDIETLPVTEQYIEFISSDGISFNSVKTNRSSTKLNSLNDEEFLSSEETDNKLYLQASAGLGIRIEIPYLRDILLSNANLIISDAVLEMIPVSGSYRNNAKLPSAMIAYGYNFNNELYSSEVGANANLIEDLDLGRDTRYQANITTFVKNQILNPDQDINGLVFSLPADDFRSTVDRVYIGDQNSEYRLRLLLRYTVVNE